MVRIRGKDFDQHISGWEKIVQVLTSLYFPSWMKTCMYYQIKCGKKCQHKRSSVSGQGTYIYIYIYIYIFSKVADHHNKGTCMWHVWPSPLWLSIIMNYGNVASSRNQSKQVLQRPSRSIAKYTFTGSIIFFLYALRYSKTKVK